MNETIRNFMRLPSADRHLLVKTSLLLTVITVGLRVLPFRTFQRLIARVTAVSPGADITNGYSVDHLAWAVKTVSYYVPKTKCLAQALAMQLLLAQRGHSARLRIGVTRDEERMFQAHAWLECQGAIIFGESDVHYVPLPPLEGEQQ